MNIPEGSYRVTVSVSLILFLVVSVWIAGKVFARFEAVEARQVEIKERMEYINSRIDTKHGQAIEYLDHSIKDVEGSLDETRETLKQEMDTHHHHGE